MGSLSFFIRSQIQPGLLPYLITKKHDEAQVEVTCQAAKVGTP